MKWIFKILQGQHTGAELALPEPCHFTAGRSPNCDLVFCDATLPDVAFELSGSDRTLTLTARMEGVTIGGHPIGVGETMPLPCYTAVCVGMTQFCIGEADKPWRPVRASVRRLSKKPPLSPCEKCRVTLRAILRIGCVTTLCVGLLAAGAGMMIHLFVPPPAEPPSSVPPRDPTLPETLEALARQEGLTLTRDTDRTLLSGNLPTPERRSAVRTLALTLEENVMFDLTDDHSLFTAAETILQMIGDTRLSLIRAADRTLTLGNRGAPPATVARAEAMLRADIPYVRHISVETAQDTPETPCLGAPSNALPPLPILSVCETPTPCLLLSDGRRYLEGALLEGFIIRHISAKEVIFEKESVRYTWKP